MSKFVLTLALAATATAFVASADAAPRKFACDDVSTWSVCEGTAMQAGPYKVSPPPPPPHKKPAGGLSYLSPAPGISPEGTGSISGGGGAAGGGAGGGK